MEKLLTIGSLCSVSVLDRGALKVVLESLKADITGEETCIIEAEQQIVTLRRLINRKTEQVITMTLDINKVNEALDKLDTES